MAGRLQFKLDQWVSNKVSFRKKSNQISSFVLPLFAAKYSFFEKRIKDGKALGEQKNQKLNQKSLVKRNEKKKQNINPCATSWPAKIYYNLVV